jgi:hypothetical protein
MIRVEDDCVGCQLPCIGSACPYKNALHFYCDVCEEEVEDNMLWKVDGKQVCEYCLKAHFPMVDSTDYPDKTDDPEYDSYVDQLIDMAREDEMMED